MLWLFAHDFHTKLQHCQDIYSNNGRKHAECPGYGWAGPISIALTISLFHMSRQRSTAWALSSKTLNLVLANHSGIGQRNLLLSAFLFCIINHLLRLTKTLNPQEFLGSYEIIQIIWTFLSYTLRFLPFILDFQWAFNQNQLDVSRSWKTAEDRGQLLYNVREIGERSVQMISRIPISPTPRADSYQWLSIHSEVHSLTGTPKQARALLVPALHQNMDTHHQSAWMQCPALCLAEITSQLWLLFEKFSES